MERDAELKSRYVALLTEVEPHKLLAVTKYSPFSDIEILYRLGQRHFGESRVQDLKEKSQLALNAGLTAINWHFIGHLQRNKVKDLLKVDNLFAIHSIDSKKLLDELKKREHLLQQQVLFFIQVNTSGEEQKAGVATWPEVKELVDYADELAFNHFRLAGLMTIGRIRTDNFEQDAKKSFAALVQMKKQLASSHPCQLSMGMSSDYQWALEYGSDWVRIGSRLLS